MSLRAKTKRRLLILLSCSVAGAAALGGAYGVRRAVLRSHALHARDIGLAAAKVHDYETALTQLGVYLSRFPNDADALYYYSLSRENVEEPNSRNLIQAVGLWR